MFFPIVLKLIVIIIKVMDKPLNDLETVELTPQDFNRAASLLTQAFSNNPSHHYIFANPYL